MLEPLSPEIPRSSASTNCWARILTAGPDLGLLTEPLRGLVARALSNDPADRPSAAELMRVLVTLRGLRVTALFAAPPAAASLGSFAIAPGYAPGVVGIMLAVMTIRGVIRAERRRQRAT